MLVILKMCKSLPSIPTNLLSCRVINSSLDHFVVSDSPVNIYGSMGLPNKFASAEVSSGGVSVLLPPEGLIKVTRHGWWNSNFDAARKHFMLNVT